jgi:hypothetical protein
MVEDCACFHYDPNPDMGEDTCECSHVVDEHDDAGQCTVKVPVL